MFSWLSSAKSAVGEIASDAYYEVKDAIVARQEASDDLLDAGTPEDRWFTPHNGWPKAPAELSPLLVRQGYTSQSWAPPAELCPAAEEEPALFSEWVEREQIGELRVEVLEAENLPNKMTQAGTIDPYVIVVFEGAAARTSTVRNDRTPRWGADAPRAFKFPVTCPYSSLHVAVLDEDRALDDDQLGRVVIDLSQMFSGTTYDCWWPLQYGVQRHHRKKRGAVRVRLSMQWDRDRKRLAKYPDLLPTFYVPFKDARAQKIGTFAVAGKNCNPFVYRESVMSAHLIDLTAAAGDVIATVLDFLFWRWPLVSAFIFMLWQFLVSYPTMLPACFPLAALFALLRSYLATPSAPHALQRKLTVMEMVWILICNYTAPPLEAAPRSSLADGDDDSDGDWDEDEDEEATTVEAAQKRAKRERDPTSVRDVLPAIIPPAGSWQAKQDELYFEVAQEMRAEYAPETGFTLNPLIGAFSHVLGPIQKILGDLVYYVRISRRAVNWEDRILTFQISIGLLALSALLVVLGVLLALVPWAVVWEWTFRIFGILVFGPHMYCVGNSVRRHWTEVWDAEERYTGCTKEARKRMCDEKTAECERQVKAELQEELTGTSSTLSRIPGQGACGMACLSFIIGYTSGAFRAAKDKRATEMGKYKSVCVRPRPTSGKLRYLHQPDVKRSYAFPMALAAQAAQAAQEQHSSGGVAGPLNA